MTQKQTTDRQERLDRARKPVTFSALEWVLAAVGLAGMGCGVSMIHEGNVTGGVPVLIVGAACIVGFVFILLAKKRRD